MATPAWVRAHRAARRYEITTAILELNVQAEQRVQVEHNTTAWEPRRGMAFANEKGTP